MSEEREDYVIDTAVRVIDQPEDRPLVLRPVRQVQDFLDQRTAIMDIIAKAMKRDVHYGRLPGTKRNMLYKPGAEMLLQTFGLTCPDPVLDKAIEDWSGADHEGEPFFYYRYRATIYYGSRPVASAIGICNSHEDKYRFRWVPPHEVPPGIDKEHCEKRVGTAVEYQFAVRDAKTTGPYAKPAEYWQAFMDALASKTARSVKKKMGKDQKDMAAWEIDTTVYKIVNPNIADEAHTISAMAQKRAMVAATRIATCASEYFAGTDKVEKDDEGFQPGRDSEVTRQAKANEDRLRDRAENGTLQGKPVSAEQAAQDSDDLYPPKAEILARPEPQRAQPAVNGQALTPDQLKAAIALKIATHAEKEGDRDITTATHTALMSVLRKHNVSDEGRHRLLVTIVGKTSSKDLKEAEARGMLWWLNDSRSTIAEEIDAAIMAGEAPRGTLAEPVTDAAQEGLL